MAMVDVDDSCQFSAEKNTEAVLSNSTRKLLWFKSAYCTLRKKIYCVIYYNFGRTFVLYICFLQENSLREAVIVMDANVRDVPT